jgi:pimeloyl-ACP methyl ester carboxylesterase
MEVASHGHRLSYVTAGEGEPLVLIPGFMQAAADWVDLGYPTLLGDRFRLIIIDPLGFGESDKPHASADDTSTARVDHLDAVLDAERIDAAHVWGYSFGTMIAEAFARLRPARTRSIVLGGSLPGLTGVDRKNLSGSSVDIYRGGDWDRVWTEVLPFVPAERRRLFSERNDLLACAAAEEGSFESLAVESHAMPLPMLCYVGTGEWWWEAARDVTEGAGGRFYPVQGADHAGAFMRAEEVVAEVRVFLDTDAARPEAG